MSYPWQIVIDAHGPPHERKTADVIQTTWHFISLINLDQAKINTVRFQEMGKVTGTLYFDMSEDEEGFHQLNILQLVCLLYVYVETFPVLFDI